MRFAIRTRLALFAIFLVGCGSAGDDVKVFPVKGVVTFGGKPMVGGGSIALIPMTETKGKTAGGEIKADGTYVLGTYTADDGSMPGEFRVVITQIVFQEPKPSADGAPPPPPAALAVPEADRIPAVYSSHQESPLKAKVEAKPANELNFDLQRQPAR